MEQRIMQLFRRLSFLGYGTVEIQAIIKEAIGSNGLDFGDWFKCADTIAVLEKYEKLGADYLYSYSK